MEPRCQLNKQPMKNRDDYLDFRDWGTIVAYLKGIATEALVALFIGAIALLLSVAGHLLRR